MKSNVETPKPEFKPLTLSITVETEGELQGLWYMLNASTGSLRDRQKYKNKFRTAHPIPSMDQPWGVLDANEVVQNLRRT